MHEQQDRPLPGIPVGHVRPIRQCEAFQHPVTAGRIVRADIQHGSDNSWILPRPGFHAILRGKQFCEN